MGIKPRLGIYVVGFPYQSETFIVTKVCGLIDRGFDVTIFSQNFSQDWEHFQILNRYSDIRNKIVYSPFAWRRRPIQFVLRMLWLVTVKGLQYPADTFAVFVNVFIERNNSESPFKQLFKKLTLVGHKIDILHVEFDFQSYGLIDISKKLGFKVIVSGRGDIRRTSLPYRWPDFYSYLHRYVDAYHFISDYLARNARDAGLPSSFKVRKILPAIDLSLFTPQLKVCNNEKVIIGTFARLSWAKGYEFGLDALAQLHMEGYDFEYHVYGVGQYEEAIRFCALQHDLLDSKVFFHGKVSREDVPKALSEIDIILHPAIEEGYCNAVIEAQAMQVPVVCSDAGGLPENVEDKVTASVFSRRNAKDCYDKLKWLIEQPEERRKMGRMGRERVLAKNNIDHQVDEFSKFYYEVLEL